MTTRDSSARSGRNHSAVAGHRRPATAAERWRSLVGGRRDAIVAGLAFALPLALYARTGAPGLLTGDQAEHQMVAVIVGVPHATGYPLFTMLNALAVRAIPWLDPARVVTLMTALWSALAVMLALLVARRLSGSTLAGLLAAGLLAVSPDFWALSVIAEVYTLQALFILLIWLLLLIWWGGSNPDGDAHARRALYAAAFVSGLAVTHHGSFVPIVVPALLLLVAAPLIGAGWWPLPQPAQAGFVTKSPRLQPPGARQQVLRCLLFGLLGLTPWLYLAAQYALFRPFDYYRGGGLPYHYYWGNPAGWADVANLALGGGFRGKVFTHGWAHLPALGLAFARSLRAEFGWAGLALGAIGAISLARTHRRAALLGAMIFVSAALFGINVAADVPKAPVYYLPAYVVWAVWAGVGAGWLAAGAGRLGGRGLAAGLLCAGLLLPIARGRDRFAQIDRSDDIGPGQFARGALAEVAPDAVILCRWEQCMALRYAQLAEGRRLDVQLDQTEPEAGVSWADRAALYYPRHPLYAVGFNEQLAARYPLYPVSESYDLWQIRPPQ